MRLAFVDPVGEIRWDTAAEDLGEAIDRARDALVEAELLE